MKHLTAIAVAGFLAATVLPAAAVEISGAGATFPYPIYAKWADAYKKETGVGLNYQSIGSGGGIKQIEAKTVTFGATDAPLKGGELDKIGLVQFPMVMGGIVPVVNIEGIKTGRSRHRRSDARANFPRQSEELGRSGDQEAQPSAKLPRTGDRRRSPLRRFRHHLQFHLLSCRRSAPIGNRKVGSATSVEWPVGIGAKGNEGVSNNVARPRARSAMSSTPTRCRTSWSTPRWSTRTARPSRPPADAFQAAAANADWNSVPGYGVILANQPGASSWPMTAATFILIPKAADRSGGRGRGAQVLCLGLRQGRQDGRGTRLRADAEESRR